MRATVHQLYNNATITASAQSTGVARPTSDSAGGCTVALDINVANAPTGTTPSMTVKIEVSPDGVNWFQAAVTSAITAAGQTRVTATNIVEPNVRANFQITGTTPSFTGVTAYLIFG